MSTVVTSIYDLEFVWRDAPDGFNSGADFKTWLANIVLQQRADLQAVQERIAEQARQLEEARKVINAYRALPIGPKGYTSMPLFDLHNTADEWLAANPAPQEQPRNHLYRDYARTFAGVDID